MAAAGVERRWARVARASVLDLARRADSEGMATLMRRKRSLEARRERRRRDCRPAGFVTKTGNASAVCCLLENFSLSRLSSKTGRVKVVVPEFAHRGAECGRGDLARLTLTDFAGVVVRNRHCEVCSAEPRRSQTRLPDLLRRSCLAVYSSARVRAQYRHDGCPSFLSITSPSASGASGGAD